MREVRAETTVRTIRSHREALNVVRALIHLDCARAIFFDRASRTRCISRLKSRE